MSESITPENVVHYNHKLAIARTVRLYTSGKLDHSGFLTVLARRAALIDLDARLSHYECTSLLTAIDEIVRKPVLAAAQALAA